MRVYSWSYPVDPDEGLLYVKLKVFMEMKQVFNSDVTLAYLLQFWLWCRKYSYYFVNWSHKMNKQCWQKKEIMQIDMR